MAFEPSTRWTSPDLLAQSAAEWLRQQDPCAPLVIVATNQEAGQELIRKTALEHGALMGWQCRTPFALANHRNGPQPAVLLLDLQPKTSEEQALVNALCESARDVMAIRATVVSPSPPQVVSPGQLAAVLLDIVRSGIAFDDIAVVLRDWDQQLHAVRTALRRAAIPAYFATSIQQPDPRGMAFLALLRFALNGFSLDDLTDYLSLSSKDELEAIVEQQLAITGIPTSLAAWLAIEEPRLSSVLRPILTELDDLNGTMTWQKWRKTLEKLASVAIEQPQSVLNRLRIVSAEGNGGTFDLEAVLDLLLPLFTYETIPQAGSRYGQVYVCTADQLQAHAFSVVLSCTQKNPTLRSDSNAGVATGSRSAASATSKIDFELRFLDELFNKPDLASSIGHARFLLSDSPHLARALRQRALRWRKGRWSSADGFTKASLASQEALAKHRPEHRSYSPTALQLLASCPYKFFLYAISGLKPRQVPQRVLALDPLQRGSLVHEVLFEFLSACRAQALFPLRVDNLTPTRELLRLTLAKLKTRYESLLAPISKFLWEQEMHELHADLDEWLERTAAETEWQPWLFELAFGLPGRGAQDPRSVNQPVPLDAGLKIRGAIDLVERHTSGAIRATDFKTGKARTKDGLMLGGGEVLQPLLYALVLEKMFPEHHVTGGRLYYCSSQAGFMEVTVPLKDQTRTEMTLMKSALDESFEHTMFVAAPTEGRCRYCDYQVICGSSEEERVRQLRPPRNLPNLRALRASL